MYSERIQASTEGKDQVRFDREGRWNILVHFFGLARSQKNEDFLASHTEAQRVAFGPQQGLRPNP